MVRAEEQRWVKSDENKEYSYVRIRGTINAGYDDKGKKQTVLKEEGDDKFSAGSFSRDKHTYQT
jgi:hypothetical protein